MRQRGDMEFQIAIGPFTKKDLKNRLLGNWRSTVNNCVTEVKWWNRSQDWPLFVFSASFSPAFIASVFRHRTCQYRTSLSPRKACNKTTIYQNRQPLIILLLSKTQSISEQKVSRPRSSNKKVLQRIQIWHCWLLKVHFVWSNWS